MAHDYADSLATLPCFAGLDRAAREQLARVVDDVTVAAGTVLRPSDRELVVVAAGCTTDLGDGCVLTLTPVRLLVLGPRELRALAGRAPGLEAQL